MDIKRLVILIIAAILVLVLIFAVIFSLYRLIRSRQTIVPTASVTTQSRLSATPTSVPQTGSPLSSAVPTMTPPATTKVFVSSNFQLNYPKNWRLLTCRNSPNFEFDPTNGADQINVFCDRAVKPITFQQSFLSGCSDGQVVNLGGVSAVKVVNKTASGTDYKWCIDSPLKMEVTHRVSTTDTRSAFSAVDYSKQVEEIISSLHLGQGGS